MNKGQSEVFTTAVVWDNHACLPLNAGAGTLAALERYRDFGVTVVSVNVGFGWMSVDDHLKALDDLRALIAQWPDVFRLIGSVGDVQRCKEEGKLGIIFDVEGMYPVQDDARLVELFYARGVRWMLIAYNLNNAAGGGCLDRDTGLTSVGRTVIDEMERVGMVLCLSHTGPRTAAEAIEYARNPVIFSHSNPYGVTPHPRNISDKLIQCCANRGGVIGLTGIGPFLGGHRDLVDLLLRQLRYVIDLVGTDHVALGLDFVSELKELEDYAQKNPTMVAPGIADANSLEMIGPDGLVDVADGLARDNWTDDQIRAILGGNWMRIAKRVWR